MDAGRAQAIMGNHELNALHYHTTDPDTGAPLRAHSHDNLRQHESFLKEFPLGASQTKDALDWMRGLPLFHAAWIQPAIEDLKRQTGAGVLSQDQLIRAGRKGDEFYDLVETVAKGPEARLPHSFSFIDKGRKVRHHVRLKWWNCDARNWREIGDVSARHQRAPRCTLAG